MGSVVSLLIPAGRDANMSVCRCIPGILCGLLLMPLLLWPAPSRAVIEIVIVGHEQPVAEPVETDERHVRRITEADIERQGLTSLDQLLSTQPGVELRSLGGEGSFSLMSLRGSSARQVAVFVDGQRINGAEGLAVDLSQFPLSAVESVELYYGRQPIGFAIPGAAGAIHIHLRQSARLRRLQQTWGSFGESQTALSTAWKSTHGSLQLNLDHLRVDNDFTILNDNSTELNPYDDRYEPRYNNAVKRDTLNLQAQRGNLWGGRHARASLLLSNQSQQVPNRQNDPNNHARFDKQRRQLRLELLSPDEDTILALLGSRADNRYIDRESRVGLDAQDNRYLDERLEFSLQQQMRLPMASDESAALPLVLALSLLREDYRSEQRLGSQGFKPDIERYREDWINLGLELGYQANGSRLRWSPQMRLQHRRAQRLDQLDVADSDDSATAQLALSLEQPEAIWTGFIGRYRREPGFAERYADHGFTVGNAELKPETLDSLSLGYRRRIDPAEPGIELSVEGFLRHSRDLIVISYDARGIGHYENVNDAAIGGFELRASHKAPGRLQWELSWSLTESIVSSEISSYDGKRVPNTPLQIFDLYLGDRFSRWPAWRYRARYHFEEGAYYDRANLLPTADRKQLDAGIEWLNTRWKLSFWIRNLSDRVHQAFNGFPGPGRSFQLSLALEF